MYSIGVFIRDNSRTSRHRSQTKVYNAISILTETLCKSTSTHLRVSKQGCRGHDAWLLRKQQPMLLSTEDATTDTVPMYLGTQHQGTFPSVCLYSHKVTCRKLRLSTTANCHQKCYSTMKRLIIRTMEPRRIRLFASCINVRKLMKWSLISKIVGLRTPTVGNQLIANYFPILWRCVSVSCFTRSTISKIIFTPMENILR